MKKILFAILIVIVSSSGCEKLKDELTITDGTYTGTFQRQLAFGGGEIANVSITFSSNTWTGQSDRQKYPALCNGTHTIEDEKIIFTNDCAWTADFDWSLILGGEYDLNLDGDRLEITRDYRGPASDTYIDVYILSKQE